jgi:hypothetical protein
MRDGRIRTTLLRMERQVLPLVTLIIVHERTIRVLPIDA